MSARTRADPEASAERADASRPRQEGPADLRLVPPALAAWATAAVVLHAPPGWAVTTVVASVLAAAVLLSTRGRLLLTRRRVTRRSRVTAHAVAATLLCVAAAAGSAGLHGADVRSGPVPELAREYARVLVEVEVTADPRLTRPRVSGNRMAPVSVLIEAEARRVERTGAAARTTRAPVLLIVGTGDRQPAAPAAGRGSPWLSLLPSTRLRVEAGLAPAREGGDRFAAVLRVDGREGPRAVAVPRPRSGSRDGCAPDCGRRPRICRRTRGRCCRGWSSGTPRG